VSCADATGPLVPEPTTIVPGVANIALSYFGEARTLSAGVLDQGGAAMTGAALSWASSDETVVTVDTSGVVTALGNGSAVVTVTSGRASGSISVAVAQVAASTTLTDDALAFVSLGDTLRLVATVWDAGGSPVQGAEVSWATLDSLVARVDSTGLVTAIGSGATRAVATSGATSAGSAVSVVQAPSSVELSADRLSFHAFGDTVSLDAVVLDPGGSSVAQASVTWVSDDTAVATVSPDGRVTAVGNGATWMTASSGSVWGRAEVVVRQVATSVTVLPDSLVLGDPGDTLRLTIGAWDSGGSSIESPMVSWTTADGAIASVDSTGLVTAVETGTVLITASVDGVSGQTSARVEPETTLLAVGSTTLSGEVATRHSLSVRVEDLLGAAYEGAMVSWTTAEGSGAIASSEFTTSDASGYASAVWLLGTTSGEQRASATIESRGSIVEVAFTASADPAAAVSAWLAADSIQLNGRDEMAVLGPTFTDRYANVTGPAGVVWQVRDPAVVSVDADGLVTALNEGTTYVVASLGSPTDSILVTVSFRGAITITFDDGFIDAYTNAYPVFQEFGLRGNIAVNPAQVGFPSYMTKAQLDELHGAGWSIVSHTMTHDSLTTATLGELDWELRASREWIEAQGYNGANVFVVPYHDWGARERDAIGQYYDATRGMSSTEFSPDSLVSWRPSDPYNLTGVEADFLPFTTVGGRDALRAKLQRTVHEGAFLDIFLHHLAPADVDAFRETLAVVNEFRDRVLPYHELYPAYIRTVF